MKTRLIPSAALLTLVSGVCLADTFQLKDGSTLEARILREDDTNYYLEVQVSKSIKDERTIAKADVRSIAREEPDVKAFGAIQGLMPTPDLLTPAEYATRIRAVEKFLAEHRGSGRAAAAKLLLDKLKAEANEILAGGVKLNGNLISSNEYRNNAYEIDARVMEARIRALVKEARYLEALRRFDEMGRDFRNTTPYQEVLPLATQTINTYLAQVSQSAGTFEERMSKRQTGLERMAQADRSATEAAIREETTELEALFKSEKDAKIGWVTPSPDLKASLDDTLNYGRQELSRLSSLKSATPIDGGKAYREALRLVQTGGDPSAVTTAINAVKSAQVPQKYVAHLEAAVK